jgi:hypothetical protein
MDLEATEKAPIEYEFTKRGDDFLFPCKQIFHPIFHCRRALLSAGDSIKVLKTPPF